MQMPGEDWIFSWYLIFFAMGCGAIMALKQYMKGPQCASPTKMKGKTVIVTGGSSGVGKETAKDMARRGARVIIACRDVAKGAEAVKEIAEDTKTNNTVAMLLDLASFDSVRQFAKTFLKKEPRLDILINNAGVILLPERHQSKDGFELHLATNYLGHFLLTQLLLDRLKTCSPSRIINLAAVAYQLGEIKFNDINLEEGEYNRSTAYSQSKLAVMLFTRELSKKLEGSNVTVNAIHPGVVNSDGLRHMPFKSSSLISVTFALPLWYFSKSPKDGAQTVIYCAIASEMETISGKYYVDCHEQEPTENARDDDVAKQLFEKSLELTGTA